jgi:environmental stress-induced protein Ves
MGSEIKMKIITREQFKSMPWRNGQGVTHEIFLVEAAGRMALRISMAEVTQDCDFSKFEGMMRNTTVITGAGMDLTGAGVEITLRPRVPVTFSGEMPLWGKLLDGPVTDLNVFWDAAERNVEVRVQRGVAGINGNEVVFVLEGALKVAGHQVAPMGAVWLQGEAVCGEGLFVVFEGV